ncbi:hypothetical protein [Celeribacter halophilus]|uniref:hypothetical protein n=1 Tax=Celeribacter halophilus TaxID=576117 RepID=UPI001113F538|nr:hypothetical protein [Celeribacter halophilus]
MINTSHSWAIVISNAGGSEQVRMAPLEGASMMRKNGAFCMEALSLLNTGKDVFLSVSPIALQSTVIRQAGEKGLEENGLGHK